jgi:acyl transferase domain-containing protein
MKTPRISLSSARDDIALAEARGRLAAHIETHPEQSLGDIAFTLQTGRRTFSQRFAFSARGKRGVIEKLGGAGKSETAAASPPKLAFLFPGQGAQYAGMGQGLYRRYPIVTQTIDRCAAVLEPLLGLDLRTVLYGDPEDAGPRATPSRPCGATLESSPPPCLATALANSSRRSLRA